MVIVELKQWTKIDKTEKDGIVVTRFVQGEREVPHPSYQAWSYASMLQDFNSTVQDEGINLVPCAYLPELIAKLRAAASPEALVLVPSRELGERIPEPEAVLARFKQQNGAKNVCKTLVSKSFCPLRS
jgi:hypothetical protein